MAALAWRAGLLSASGAVAATAVGAAAVQAGWPWVALLLVFFLTSSGLSRWRDAERSGRTDDIVAKGRARDAWQVLANGGVFAVAALASCLGDPGAWRAVGAGAIAAAMADTWSTEVGTILGGSPRLVTTGRVVPPGTSGAVTLTGTAAALCGAVLAALVSHGMDWGTPLWQSRREALAGRWRTRSSARPGRNVAGATSAVWQRSSAGTGAAQRPALTVASHGWTTTW